MSFILITPRLRTFFREETFVVDVATKDFLPQFLGMAEALHAKLVSAISFLPFPDELTKMVQAQIQADTALLENGGTISLTEAALRRRKETS
jgi:hypothetical protein